MSRYLDEDGLRVIANKVNEKLKTVVEIPSTAKDGDVILYIGEDTNEFSNGDIYLYHESPFTKNWYCYDNTEGDYLYFEDDPVTTSSSAYNSMNVPPTHEGDLTLNEYWHILSVEGDTIHAEYYGNEYELTRNSEYDVTTDGTWKDISGFEDSEARDVAAGAMALAQAAMDNENVSTISNPFTADSTHALNVSEVLAFKQGRIASFKVYLEFTNIVQESWNTVGTVDNSIKPLGETPLTISDGRVATAMALARINTNGEVQVWGTSALDTLSTRLSSIYFTAN